MLKPLPTPTASDLLRLAGYNSSVRVRALIEMAIARQVIGDLLAAGYIIQVNNFDELLPERDHVEQLMSDCFEVEDCFLRCRKPKGKERSWVRFVMGNAGWDLVCDYTVDLKVVLEKTNELTDDLSAWC